jgi:hypothetical protein
MYQQEDVIIRDSEKQFRLRINGFLRRLDVAQIIGTNEYIEIEFIGGECGIRVAYPRELEDLRESLKKELLAETQLGLIEIDNIRFYIVDHIDEIEEARKNLSQ